MGGAARSVATVPGRRGPGRLARSARIVLLVLGIAALGPAGATAGATASAVGALTDAGGQVVFDFPHTVGYSVAVAPSRIIVTFTEPFTGTLEPLGRAMPGIVGRADLSADRKVATLYLRGAYALKSQAVGASIILDLAASAATRNAVSKAGYSRPAASVWLDPAPAAGTEVIAGKLRTVDVAYSREAGFERLTFDWHAAVPYRVEQGDGTARIEFEAPGRIDLPALRAQMGGADFKIDALPGDKSLVVTLSLPPEASVRHALSGGHVVVDIAKGLSTVAPDRLRHAAGGTVTLADDGAKAEAAARRDAQGARGRRRRPGHAQRRPGHQLALRLAAHRRRRRLPARPPCLARVQRSRRRSRSTRSAAASAARSSRSSRCRTSTRPCCAWPPRPASFRCRARPGSPGSSISSPSRPSPMTASRSNPSPTPIRAGVSR